MEPGRVRSAAMPDTVLNCFMPYVTEAKDRGIASLVCRGWYQVERLTRKHVTIAFCYATTPERLHRRYPNIESLKLKGRPRLVDVPEDWGGYVEPWIREIGSFKGLNILHFNRMIVNDADLEFLANIDGLKLRVLKLHNCSGFSTNGLLHITSSYRNLRTLFLKGSTIEEFDGKWLHALATNNKDLKALNFYMTNLQKYEVLDLELLARNCQSLFTVAVDGCGLAELNNFFRAATSLREFHGGIARAYENVVFPTTLCQLGLLHLKKPEMHIIFPISASLKKLRLHVSLNEDDYCLLFGRCPNLEALETTTGICDRGLEALADDCKKLRRLRIDKDVMEDAVGLVTQRGLIVKDWNLSQGCLDLEYLEVYASQVTNASLESIGTNMKNLSHFALCMPDEEERTNFSLDNGIRELLRGCNQLTTFDLLLVPGAVTDLGLSYIGQYSPNVRRMALGCVGKTDEGLLAFSKGCPSLQELELPFCKFSKPALVVAATQLTALRYLTVDGIISSGMFHDLLAMARPYWNIELISNTEFPFLDEDGKEIPLIFAYYSLDGPRSDFLDSVSLLGP